MQHDAGLRVGTWNVQYGRGAEKNRLRRELLLSRGADVWVLTETHDELDLPSPYLPFHSLPRYGPDQGGRWVTIWTRLPIVETIKTDDPSRTLCVRLSVRDSLEVVVFGTVLPWMHDGTESPRKLSAWSEFYRVTAEQSAEWRRLRDRHGSAALIVAGDLNHNLGGPHYYGTNQGRKQLRAALAESDLTCLTETENFPADQLAYPPIDHVCCAPPSKRQLSATVEGWQKTTQAGETLSDHSGVLADIRCE